MWVYIWTDTPWTTTETYSLSLAWGSWATSTTTSIYKAWYKITKVIIEWQVPINSSNSWRSHIWISSDSWAYWTDVDCYLWYNYSSLWRTWDFKVASNWSNIKTQALWAWGWSSWTLTEYQEITEEWYTLTFNSGTLSWTWNSTEANAIHTIFTSSTATFWISKNNTNWHTATITVTYEQI